MAFGEGGGRRVEGGGGGELKEEEEVNQIGITGCCSLCMVPGGGRRRGVNYMRYQGFTLMYGTVIGAHHEACFMLHSCTGTRSLSFEFCCVHDAHLPLLCLCSQCLPNAFLQKAALCVSKSRSQFEMK